MPFARAVRHTQQQCARTHFDPHFDFSHYFSHHPSALCTVHCALCTVARMKGQGAVPEIFAQQTERNERICSLLSAVGMRSIQPKFDSAIRASFPSAIEAQRLQSDFRPKHTDRGCVLLFVGKGGKFCVFTDSLKKTVDSTALISAEVSLEGDANDSRRMDRLFASLHPQTQIYAFATDEAAGWLQSYLSQASQQNNSISMHLKGIVTVDSTSIDSSRHPVETIYIPHLSLWTQPRFQVLSNMQSLWNPATIVIFNRWDRQVAESDHHLSLWVCRAVLIFINSIVKTERPFSPSECSHGTASPVHVKLMSRL